jgi:hypothetical protein
VQQIAVGYLIFDVHDEVINAPQNTRANYDACRTVFWVPTRRSGSMILLRRIRRNYALTRRLYQLQTTGLRPITVVKRHWGEM